MLTSVRSFPHKFKFLIWASWSHRDFEITTFSDKATMLNCGVKYNEYLYPWKFSCLAQLVCDWYKTRVSSRNAVAEFLKVFDLRVLSPRWAFSSMSRSTRNWKWIICFRLPSTRRLETRKTKNSLYARIRIKEMTTPIREGIPTSAHVYWVLMSIDNLTQCYLHSNLG